MCAILQITYCLQCYKRVKLGGWISSPNIESVILDATAKRRNVIPIAGTADLGCIWGAETWEPMIHAAANLLSKENSCCSVSFSIVQVRRDHEEDERVEQREAMLRCQDNRSPRAARS